MIPGRKYLHAKVATGPDKSKWPKCSRCGKRDAHISVYEDEKGRDELCPDCRNAEYNAAMKAQKEPTT
jgi:hypothetical protein